MKQYIREYGFGEITVEEVFEICLNDGLECVVDGDRHTVCFYKDGDLDD